MQRLKANISVIGTRTTELILNKPSYVAGPLNGRVEPMLKKLLLPAFSRPTVTRSVVGLSGTIRLMFRTAMVPMHRVKARGMFR